jgi:hypothetical protein
MPRIRSLSVTTMMGRRRYRPAMARRDVQAAAAAEDPAPVQRRLGDGRRVDDRDQGFEVGKQVAVEEGCIPVEQAVQVDVAA